MLVYWNSFRGWSRRQILFNVKSHKTQRARNRGRVAKQGNYMDMTNSVQQNLDTECCQILVLIIINVNQVQSTKVTWVSWSGCGQLLMGEVDCLYVWHNHDRILFKAWLPKHTVLKRGFWATKLEVSSFLEAFESTRCGLLSIAGDQHGVSYWVMRQSDLLYITKGWGDIQCLPLRKWQSPQGQRAEGHPSQGYIAKGRRVLFNTMVKRSWVLSSVAQGGRVTPSTEQESSFCRTVFWPSPDQNAEGLLLLVVSKALSLFPRFRNRLESSSLSAELDSLGFRALCGCLCVRNGFTLLYLTVKQQVLYFFSISAVISFWHAFGASCHMTRSSCLF